MLHWEYQKAGAQDQIQLVKGEQNAKKTLVSYEEGMRSQALYSSGAPKIALLRGLPKLILPLLGILGLLRWLVR